jgi:hypothetical protein
MIPKLVQMSRSFYLSFYVNYYFLSILLDVKFVSAYTLIQVLEEDGINIKQQQKARASLGSLFLICDIQTS